jgi:adenylate kinase
LDAATVKAGAPIHAVLDFEVDDAQIVERIVHRRVCNQCGSWYNTRSLPPKVAGVCDRCGAPLAQRDDDREEVVRRRLTVYRSQTAPLIAYYERQGLLRAIDAAAPAEQVEQAVHQVVVSLDRKG